MASRNTKRPLVGAIFAAIGASVCCLGPLLLLSLGIGGAWVGTLSAFDPYRPYLIALTLLFLGLAFRKLYLNPQACRPDESCAGPSTSHRQKRVFWIVTVLALALLAAPTVLVFVL